MLSFYFPCALLWLEALAIQNEPIIQMTGKDSLYMPQDFLTFIIWPLYFSVLSASLFSASPLELEELVQTLKWAQHCLSDTQSQQDVELIMQLLAREDFRNAYAIYSAVTQQRSRVSPNSPLTVQAQDLCQEVCRIVILNQLVKAENKHCGECLWICCSRRSYGKVMEI